MTQQATPPAHHRPSILHSAFHWPVRVYYEDTDAAGIVYYANYLRLFERCRTEWMRALGVDHRSLAERDQMVFVVSEASVHYHRPARLDDALLIEAKVVTLGRSFMVFEQKALRDDLVLASGRVKIACVDVLKQRPMRMPARLYDVLDPGAKGASAPASTSPPAHPVSIQPERLAP